MKQKDKKKGSIRGNKVGKTKNAACVLTKKFIN